LGLGPSLTSRSGDRRLPIPTWARGLIPTNRPPGSDRNEVTCVECRGACSWCGDVRAHLYTVWIARRTTLSAPCFQFHIASTLCSRNPKKGRRLRAFAGLLDWRLRIAIDATEPPGSCVVGEAARTGYRGRAPTQPRAQALDDPGGTPAGQMEPLACSIRPEMAHRGAVWEVGPRADQTRSARRDEPGRMAIRPGDGCRGPVHG